MKTLVLGLRERGFRTKRRCNDIMYSDNWSLPTEEIFRVRSKNRLVANLPVVDFSFLAARNANTKATEYVTFGFSSSPSRNVRTSLSVSDKVILVVFSHNPKTFQQTILDRE